MQIQRTTENRVKLSAQPECNVDRQRLPRRIVHDSMMRLQLHKYSAMAKIHHSA